jgi:hypothetical protein
MPSFTGSGTVYFGGCTKYRLYLYSIYKYQPGDVLFFKNKALVGKLERVAIKRVRLVNNKQTSGVVTFVYQDTLNALYNEDELVNEYVALQLAKEYYERQMFLTMSAVKPCTTW